jgi:DNA-binding LacI/PurR family transcriptional regulator
MENLAETQDVFTQSIANVLSQPPTRAGMRLKSEEELASLLSVGRRQVRKSLQILEREGILERRRRSGTYVRRVPVAYSTDNAIPEEGNTRINAELLFADNNQFEFRARTNHLSQTQRRLRLDIWGDLHLEKINNQLILSGMVRAADQLGHDLRVHSLVQSQDQPLHIEEVAEQLRQSHCDGYLVVNRWADLFLQSIKKRSAPIIFFTTGIASIRHEPLMMTDIQEAIERSIQIFDETGYRRIGMVALGDINDHSGSLEVQTYEEALARRSLTYKASALTSLDFSQIIKVINELFSRPDPPDALYVADDYVLARAIEVLKMIGKIPGKDVAVIAFANVGLPLPTGYDWSRIEFDLTGFGRRLVHELVRQIKDSTVTGTTMSVHGTWKAGTTHLLNR